MKVSEFVKWLDQKYPASVAESWDNVGLLVENDDVELKKVFLALDLTEKALNQAISFNADMIITHHPMIFSGIKRINNDSSIGRKIISLIKNNITYYAMHTNYDILGMADLSARLLKLSMTEVLFETDNTNGVSIGLGKVGMLPKKMTLREFGLYVKECNQINDVRIYGDLNRIVEKVAICTGSGKSMIQAAISAGVDVYVTGDIDHHTGIDTVEAGLPIVDAGHYGTEYIFSGEMKRVLMKEFPELEIICERETSPYTIL